MNTHRIPGNEPDTADMAKDPAIPVNNLTDSTAADLAEENEAAKLGDFA